MSRVFAALVATMLVFGVFIYLLVMVPTLGALGDVFLGFDAMGDQEEAQFERTEMIATRIVPAILVIGAVFFGYVAVARRQGHTGRL